ncbi:MAG TPA: hypothetical protein VHF22_01575, partial [Planctomycetota bacterium]|nr:hypothetical protein [Planctomycetota bacterium]
PDAPGRPRIAIVDWVGMKTSAEFNAFRRFFEERGHGATVADPRDLRFDGERLRDKDGEPVDLVYRRVVSTEYFSAPPPHLARPGTAWDPYAADLTRAYLADRVCVVGSFRSDVAFDKRFMALLTTPEHQDALGLAPGARELFARVFPWTRILRAGPVLEEARRGRERLVLKPAGLYEGRGVVIGVEAAQPVWEAALEAAAAEGNFVVQERVVPPELTVELVEGGRWRPRSLYLSLGEYCFGGRLAGFNARVASTLVLSADDDERLLPVVLLGR